MRSFMSADIRTILLRTVADQMSGRDVRYFDPTDFFYLPPHAFPMFSVSGEVVGYVPSHLGPNETRLAVHGPYADLSAGKWQAEFVPGENCCFRDFDGLYDVTVEDGTRVIVSSRQFPADGQFELVLENEVKHLEIRIYARSSPLEFSYLKLERVPGQIGPSQECVGTDAPPLAESKMEKELLPSA